MQILHINCNYIYSKLHQSMIEKLEKAGINNKVYCPVRRNAEGIVVPNSNVVVSECFESIDRLVFYYKQDKIWRDLQSKIEVEQYDIVHAYTLFTDGNIAYQIYSRFGIPYFVAVRDTDVNTFFKKAPYLKRRGIEILKHAERVFFLSETYLKLVISKYVPKELREEIQKKSCVIPNGIDDYWLTHIYQKDSLEAIQDRIMKKKIVHAVYVGAISKRKNVSISLRALSILRKEGWQIDFTVIGKVENRSEHRKIERDEFTRYLGPKKKEEILQILRTKDIFIMPSLTETFGLTYAEAMSQGVPIIYSRGQGFDGQFEEGLVGYAVDARSADDISVKIKMICNKYQELSLNCSRNVNVFDWDRIVDKYIEFYKQSGH